MEFCDGIMYSIKQGDTLYSISMKYKVPLALLLRANPYVDVYNLQIGDTICIPVRRKETQRPCRYPKGCLYSDTDQEMSEQMEDKSVVQRMAEEDMAEADITGSSEGKKEENMMETMADNTFGNREHDRDDDRDHDRDDRDDDDDMRRRGNRNAVIQWKRYVTKPGDTLQTVITEGDGVSEDELEDFVEKNGAGRIYLLPGIAYYIRR